MANRKHWKYKNLTFFFLGIIFAIFLAHWDYFHNFLLNLGDYGYIGAFIGGMLFASTFSVGTGIVIILVLAQELSKLEISVIAGAGSVLTDLFIFRFVKDRLIEELSDIFDYFGGNHYRHILHSKYFSWTMPVMGALIIASPFPDELGVSLMGISKISTWKFLVIAFFLDVLSVLFVVSASSIIKP